MPQNKTTTVIDMCGQPKAETKKSRQVFSTLEMQSKEGQKVGRWSLSLKMGQSHGYLPNEEED